MAYNHYFHHQADISKAQWKAIRNDVMALIPKLPRTNGQAREQWLEYPLRDGIMGLRETPLSNRNPHDAFSQKAGDNQWICINGSAELGPNEGWFMLARRDDGDVAFEHCNTDRKPYDFLVCAILIVVDHHAPGCRDIQSDGDPHGWAPSLEFVQDHVQPDATLPLGVDPGRIGNWLVKARRSRKKMDPSTAILREDVEQVPETLFF